MLVVISRVRTRATVVAQHNKNSVVVHVSGFERGRQVDIIKLYGAMELAPIMTLSDEIVDIVDTGNTLKANGLEPRDKIFDISSRLVVNKAAMKMKYLGIQKIIDSLQRAVG